MKNVSFFNKVFCPTFSQKSWWVWVKPQKKIFLTDYIVNNIFQYSYLIILVNISI